MDTVEKMWRNFKDTVLPLESITVSREMRRSCEREEPGRMKREMNDSNKYKKQACGVSRPNNKIKIMKSTQDHKDSRRGKSD